MGGRGFLHVGRFLMWEEPPEEALWAECLEADPPGGVALRGVAFRGRTCLWAGPQRGGACLWAGLLPVS